MNKIIIEYYITNTGKAPFTDWVENLDKPIRAIIQSRLARITLGNFGDSHSIRGAQGISELRFDVGSGYRIYYGKQEDRIVILLLGGDKRTQTRDIEKAKRYWDDYKGKK